VNGRNYGGHSPKPLREPLVEYVEENQGPIGALLQSCSVLLCLTLSLAGNGEGLGTLGLHEPKLRELGTEAGFSSVRRIPMDNPFNSLYELRP